MHSSLPLCPASGSCSMKSGVFLLSLETFSDQWEGFFWELAHIQEHSGFTAVLQHLNAAYGAQVPLFLHQRPRLFFFLPFFLESRKRGHLMSVSLVGKKNKFEKWKLDGEKEPLFFFFFPLSPPPPVLLIANFGSDDNLILSLWVCETTPSVCFPLIRVIATNITATVPLDKLFYTKAKPFLGLIVTCLQLPWWSRTILHLITISIYLIWHCSHTTILIIICISSVSTRSRCVCERAASHYVFRQ